MPLLLPSLLGTFTCRCKHFHSSCSKVCRSDVSGEAGRKWIGSYIQGILEHERHRCSYQGCCKQTRCCKTGKGWGRLKYMDTKLIFNFSLFLVPDCTAWISWAWQHHQILRDIPARSKPLLHYRFLHLQSNSVQMYLLHCYDLFFFPPGFAINLSVHDYIHVQRHELETERSIRWAQQIAEGVVMMSL